MPRRLIARCQPDSIREFRAAAAQRYQDGLAAASQGRRTAAIYLWGYSVEMTLKAAYFALASFAEDQALTWGDILDAINRGRTLGIAWPTSGQGHNVRAWAELQVLVRATTHGAAYPDPSLALTVQEMGLRLEPLWRESLRYRKNVAYEFEVQLVRESAEWFLLHSPLL